MDKSLKKIAKDLAKSIHQSECNFHRKVISVWIHHTQIDVLVAQSVQAVKDRVKSKGLSEEEIWNIFTQILGCKKTKEDCKFSHCYHWAKCDLLAQTIHTKISKKMEEL